MSDTEGGGASGSGLSQHQDNDGAPKSYHVIKIDSTKVVTEKIVFNLIQKTQSVTPISVRVLNIPPENGTVIFLIYENEGDALDTNGRFVNHHFRKKAFARKYFKLLEKDIP